MPVGVELNGLLPGRGPGRGALRGPPGRADPPGRWPPPAWPPRPDWPPPCGPCGPCGTEGRGPGRGAPPLGAPPLGAPPLGAPLGALGASPLGALGASPLGASGRDEPGACGTGPGRVVRSGAAGAGADAAARGVSGRTSAAGALGAPALGDAPAGALALGLALGDDVTPGRGPGRACTLPLPLPFGRGPGRCEAPPLDRPPDLPDWPPSGPKASLSLRTTGASIVEDAERTNSPISWSLTITVLLSTPNSFASS
jgi:hypothetical protein